MARTKSTPLKREVSDSWMEKHGSPLQEAISISQDAGDFLQNGNAPNGTVSSKQGVASEGSEEKAAGLHELLICAAGIYASL